ncbi:tetratricopeptide repeat protein [Mangrovimonas aestuarii]|uniref:aerotolerance regulator BatC n=1 Tax=Mangrovimonas aestuarii TaxID=3018443 RepID=UPI0023798968|nr:aerotolerance regulator BatC [Mangrovimonas aestuarii]
MRYLITYIVVFITWTSFSQDEDKQELKAILKADEHVYEGNEAYEEDDFVSAEIDYRQAISEHSNHTAGAYNLGYSYYQKGHFDEALYRNQQAAQYAENKADKHKAFHNMGNIFMKEKKCKLAVEAFKNALRNDPSDDETRYNLALAKDCAKNQQDPPQEEDEEGDNKTKKEQEKEEKDNNQQNQDQNQQQDQKDDNDQGDQDKQEGEQNKDEEGKPKEDKKDDGKGERDKQPQQPKQQPGQLSPQQVKNILEAMNNQEQKVQEKVNAEKMKGAKLPTEKDW